MKCACGKTISENKEACRACLEAQAAKAAALPQPTGVLEILNVQGGDVKITYDKDNPSETIRAKRIITDMLRRGFALIVEIERDGKKAYERIKDFDEARGEYIVADFDPLAARESDMEEGAYRLRKQRETNDVITTYPPVDQAYIEKFQKIATVAVEPEDTTLCSCGRPKGHKGPHKKERRLPMETTKATAVGRSAGG
jgi:hypothetical protein